MKTIFNNNYSLGKLGNFPDQVKNKYTCDIYQGDTSDIQFSNSCAFAAGAWLPTGSICYIGADGLATPVKPTLAAGQVCVPYIVKVGTDRKTTISEKYNVAGGLVTLLPLTGYFRLVTTVFEAGEGISYNHGDLLIAKSFLFDGKTVTGVSSAAGLVGGVHDVIGIVDAPASVDVKRNAAIKFTAYFVPSTEEEASSDSSL